MNRSIDRRFCIDIDDGGSTVRLVYSMESTPTLYRVVAYRLWLSFLDAIYIWSLIKESIEELKQASGRRKNRIDDDGA